MSFAMFVTWVLVGVVAGVLAGLVVQRGGYGLKRDVILGLVGSVGASVIFRTLGVLTEAGIAVSAIIAFVGAARALIHPTDATGRGERRGQRRRRSDAGELLTG